MDDHLSLPVATYSLIRAAIARDCHKKRRGLRAIVNGQSLGPLNSALAVSASSCSRNIGPDARLALAVGELSSIAEPSSRIRAQLLSNSCHICGNRAVLFHSRMLSVQRALFPCLSGAARDTKGFILRHDRRE